MISESAEKGRPIRRQAPYRPACSFYVQGLLIGYMIAWPMALLAAPAIWRYHPLAGVLYAVTVGLHLNTQLGFFYHELWHKVFFKSAARNRFFYWIISLYQCSDPQIYGIAHATHHKDIHTFNDLEFWPVAEPRNATMARVGLIFELLFGVMAWEVRAATVIMKRKEYSKATGLLFKGGWMVMLGGISWAAYGLYGAQWWYVILAYWLHLWLFAVALRMLQYLEHLGITAPQLDYKTRASLTRNTRKEGFTNRLWHKLTLNETAEHTLHHFRASIPYRRYVPLSPPSPSAPVRTVSATALPGIIWRYWKDPLREIGADSPELKEVPSPAR
jgi:hypothetical protein